MFPLAHLGISIGVAEIAAVARSNCRFFPRRPAVSSGNSTLPAASNPGENSWLSFLGQYWDLRFLMLGSLLPDIIDKPLDFLVFNNSRTIFHSLFFLLLLTIVGILIWRISKDSRLILVSAGNFTHLILDQMWLLTHILFWPLKGLDFPIVIRSSWLMEIIHNLITKPTVYFMEVVGLLILLCFFLMLFNRKTLLSFIRYGRI